MQLVCEHYQNMIPEYSQKVEFEGSEIVLDIPYPGGVTKENGVWRIISLGPPVVRIALFFVCMQYKLGRFHFCI